MGAVTGVVFHFVAVVGGRLRRAHAARVRCERGLPQEDHEDLHLFGPESDGNRGTHPAQDGEVGRKQPSAWLLVSGSSPPTSTLSHYVVLVKGFLLNRQEFTFRFFSFVLIIPRSLILYNIKSA